MLHTAYLIESKEDRDLSDLLVVEDASQAVVLLIPGVSDTFSANDYLESHGWHLPNPWWEYADNQLTVAVERIS